MKIEREFIGTTKLEEILYALMKSKIDSYDLPMYDNNVINVIPSKSEGETKK